MRRSYEWKSNSSSNGGAAKAGAASGGAASAGATSGCAGTDWWHGSQRPRRTLSHHPRRRGHGHRSCHPLSDWRILRLTCRAGWLDHRQTCPTLRFQSIHGLQLDNCPDFGLLDNFLDHICGTTVRRRRRLSGVLGLRLGLPRRGLVVVVIAAAVAAVVSSVIVALNRRPDAPVDGASIAIIPVAPIVIWPAIVVPISAAIAVTTPAVPVVVAQVIVAPIPSPATLNLSVILATAIEVAVAIEVTVSVIATVATAALGIAAAAVHELGGSQKKVVAKACSYE